MKRIVEPELLDELPPGDPRAAGSRRDLRRLNAWMRNHAIMANALKENFPGAGRECGRLARGFLKTNDEHAGELPALRLQMLELGAGDGDFLLRVAQRLSSFEVPSREVRGNPSRLKPELRTTGWNEVTVTLLDRQKVVTPQTLAAFASLGWRAEAVVADIFDWAQTPAPAEIVIINEVLHHFDDARLAGLFRVIAGRTRWFIAIEPRRALWPMFCSRLLWAVGCNAVTRHDAAVSVRAGFFGNELSALWPDREKWQLTERRAGMFSHLFIASRSAGGSPAG
jgi:hypothetical protein